MSFLRSIPAFLSLLMLAAHFFRAELLPLVAVCLVTLVLLLVPRNWAVRLVQVVLMVGALEWVRAMLEFISDREQEGRPWTRLMVILLAVELFTVFSAILLQGRLRRRAVPAPADAAAEPAPAQVAAEQKESLL